MKMPSGHMRLLPKKMCDAEKAAFRPFNSRSVKEGASLLLSYIKVSPASNEDIRGWGNMSNDQERLWFLGPLFTNFFTGSGYLINHLSLACRTIVW